MECRVYLSAFNHADTDVILRAVDQAPWREKDMVREGTRGGRVSAPIQRWFCSEQIVAMSERNGQHSLNREHLGCVIDPATHLCGT